MKNLQTFSIVVMSMKNRTPWAGQQMYKIDISWAAGTCRT